MERRPISGHCNDKTLVAYSDCELSGIRPAATRRHLAVCRRCRTRQANLKCIVWRIRRLLAKRSLFDVIGTEGAKQRFLRWRDNFEMLRLTEPSDPPND
jgi:anti-sigma factor RsiW